MAGPDFANAKYPTQVAGVNNGPHIHKLLLFSAKFISFITDKTMAP